MERRLDSGGENTGLEHRLRLGQFNIERLAWLDGAAITHHFYICAHMED
jgi:hypothetical protein